MIFQRDKDFYKNIDYEYDYEDINEGDDYKISNRKTTPRSWDIRDWYLRKREISHKRGEDINEGNDYKLSSGKTTPRSSADWYLRKHPLSD